jgi:ubiquitin-activating enzyme E1
MFQDLFHEPFQFIFQWAQNPDFIHDFRIKFPDKAGKVFKSVRNELISKPQTIADCAAWARQIFENLFVTKILDTLHQYENDKTFWTGARRKPSPIIFDPADENHSLFIVSVATIRARIWGIPVLATDEILHVASAIVPESRPHQREEVDDLLHQLLDLTLTLRNLVLHPEDFEKDDDSNGHMDFVASTANLRAINYQIAPTTRLEARRIVGKIIPAMATTTAMVCGFVCFELCKIHCVTHKKLEDYRNGSISLAFFQFSLSEPVASVKLPLGGTDNQFDPVWEIRDVLGDLPVGDFIQQIETQNQVKVHSLYCSGSQLWSDSDSEDDERRRKTLTEIIAQVPNSAIQTTKRVKVAVDSCIPDTGNDAHIPLFRLNYSS